MKFPFQLPLLLDGATGSNLMAAGMPQGVCVEQWISENPNVITALQSAFVSAGSDVLYAPTFAANRIKLAHYGLEKQVESLNAKLVGLTRSCAGNRALVAGDLSPTGVFIEPFGDATFQQLVEAYREQAAALDRAGVDLFVCETMMSLAEIRAALLACRPFGKPVFATITVDEKGRTLTGADALATLINLEALGVSAFGFNCSAGPDKLLEHVRRIAPYAHVPIIAKPNAGAPNPLIPNQYDLSPSIMAGLMRELVLAGAQIIGGCCGSTPEHIAEMRKMLDTLGPVSPVAKQGEGERICANETEVFFLHEDMQVSDPVACGVDMADDLLDLEDEGYDIVRIQINTVDDAYQFSLNAHMVRLPVCFIATNEKALEAALYYYQGTALVDLKTDEVTDEAQIAIAKKYGALLY